MPYIVSLSARSLAQVRRDRAFDRNRDLLYVALSNGSYLYLSHYDADTASGTPVIDWRLAPLWLIRLRADIRRKFDPAPSEILCSEGSVLPILIGKDMCLRFEPSKRDVLENEAQVVSFLGSVSGFYPTNAQAHVQRSTAVAK